MPGRAQPRTSRLQINAAANLSARAWSAILNLACVPLYVRALGVEAYGLVGFHVTLFSVFGLLDMGLSTTLNRELARLSTQPTSAHDQRNLVRTFEVVYAACATVIGGLVLLVAPSIARNWVNPENLPIGVVEGAIRQMGIVIALQFPFTLYQGGLLGLQRHVLLNGVLVGLGTVRAVGAVIVLWFVSADIGTFFRWQLVVSAVQTVLAAWLMWRSLPIADDRPRFDVAVLRRVRRFAAGMTGIALTSVVLMQMDKVILSKILRLELFGYYTLAGVVASGLYTVIGPIFAAVFPKLSELVAVGDDVALRALYHRSCRAMSVLLFPIAITLLVFAREVMLFWTGDAVIAERTSALVALLVAGTLLNGLMNIPYAAQLAYGWTGLTFWTNVVAVTLLAPAVVVLGRVYGAHGAAAVWVALNAGYVCFGLRLMHRRILTGELRAWVIRDVGTPLMIALLVAGIARVVLPIGVHGRLPGAMQLALVVALSAGACAAAVLPGAGQWAVARMRRS
jgi:O-antigen/teichoic acid export membrane protein